MRISAREEKRANAEHTHRLTTVSDKSQEEMVCLQLISPWLRASAAMSMIDGAQNRTAGDSGEVDRLVNL